MQITDGLLRITKVAFAGEREMRLPPLVRALKTPRLVDSDRFKPQPVNAAVDKMGETGAGVFDELPIGRASGCLRAVVPPRNPVPFAGGIPVIEPYLNDRSGRTCLLDAGEEAVCAILVRFNFHNHRFLV